MPAADDEAPPPAASQSRPSGEEGAPAAAATATDANPAPTLYRSGWASTVMSPMKQSFVPTTEARRESEVHRQAREAKAAAERVREREAQRDVEEEADADEKEDTGEQQQLEEGKREELDRVDDFDGEEKEGEAATAEEEQTEENEAKSEEQNREEDADAAAAREAAPVVDVPKESAELEKAEEGEMEANASDADATDKQGEESHTEPKVAWWRNKKYRVPILISLLVAIGGIIGLAVGLSGGSDDGNADDGESSDNALDQIPLVVDRSESCEFELKDTAFLSAAGNMTGGRADADGDNAVVAAHDENGVGAVWALSKSDYTWTAQTPLPGDGEEMFGWDVAIRGETIVVGSPGYGGGRGAAHVFRKNQDGAWCLQQILEPENAEPDSAFGTSVDIAECECLIAVGGTRGSAFVFSQFTNGQTGDNVFVETQKETPNMWKSQFANGGLGQTVAISDELLAVKAPSDFIEETKGVVYMYKRGADGIYEEVDRLSAPEGGLYTPEGEQSTPSNSPQVALLDDFVLVGAPGLNAVHVFQETPLGRYQKVSELVAFDATPGSNRAFGHRLDGEGADVLVSDPVDDSSYLFSYDGGVWNGGCKHGSAAFYVSSPTSRPATVISVASKQNEFGPVNVYDIV